MKNLAVSRRAHAERTKPTSTPAALPDNSLSAPARLPRAARRPLHVHALQPPHARIRPSTPVRRDPRYAHRAPAEKWEKETRGGSDGPVLPLPSAARCRFVSGTRGVGHGTGKATVPSAGKRTAENGNPTRAERVVRLAASKRIPAARGPARSATYRAWQRRGNRRDAPSRARTQTDARSSTTVAWIRSASRLTRRLGGVAEFALSRTAPHRTAPRRTTALGWFLVRALGGCAQRRWVDVASEDWPGPGHPGPS